MAPCLCPGNPYSLCSLAILRLKPPSVSGRGRWSYFFCLGPCHEADHAVVSTRRIKLMRLYLRLLFRLLFRSNMHFHLARIVHVRKCGLSSKTAFPGRFGSKIHSKSIMLFRPNSDVRLRVMYLNGPPFKCSRYIKVLFSF